MDGEWNSGSILEPREFWVYSGGMLQSEIVSHFNGLLEIERYERADSAINGLQIGPKDKEVQTMGFAVDACKDTIDKAVRLGCDMLVVHHGLWWGRPYALTGAHYERMASMVQGELSLYACHLPLDAHPDYGNNAGLARVLKLEDVVPFGMYKGVSIGCQGHFSQPMALDQVVRDLFVDGSKPISVLNYGPSTIETVAMVSGGAPYDVEQAIDSGVDLYITGDASHNVVHRCREEGIHVIFAGHYYTEVWGVQALAQYASERWNIATHFIESPTGL